MDPRIRIHIKNVMDLEQWYKDDVSLSPVLFPLVQGLPFLVGLLLMHLEEEEAFNLLKYLMFHLGLRNQFKPDMTGLQVQLVDMTSPAYCR
jgi:hypothetical protein